MYSIEATQGERLSVFARLALILQTLNGASRFAKAKVAGLSKKPDTSNHPKVTSFGLPRLREEHYMSPVTGHPSDSVESTDNVPFIGTLPLSPCAPSEFMV